MRSIQAFTAAALALLSGAACAETACLEDDKAPPVPLTGKLVERTLVSSPFPAVPKGTFYTLELDKSVCLNGSFSQSVRKEIRSVHVYSMDQKKFALLKKYRGKRVSAQFVSVFEEHTAHHLRPMIGDIATITPLR